MRIELSKVPAGGGVYEEEVSAAVLELEDDPHVRLAGPIACHVVAQKVSHKLVVRGRWQVALSLECARCARFFSTSLSHFSFIRTYDAPEGVEFVDLTEDIREDVLLHLPAFPLCSVECRGLCPRCGRRLDAGPCACKPAEDRAGTWKALDGLKGLKTAEGSTHGRAEKENVKKPKTNADPRA